MAIEETLEEQKSASADLEEANEVEKGGDVEMSEKNHDVCNELEEDKGESMEAKNDEIAEEGKEKEKEEKDLSEKEGSKEEMETTNEEEVVLSAKEVEPVTPNERPTRVRKLVERYSEPSSARVSATKLSIRKGTGTQLRDIPNVAFKLSKRKPDENLQILHTLLYNKKAKVHSLKKNIGQFSGFIWIENEEKQREKVKEKFDKCNKEKLIDFCDVLNIPIIKTTIKKEELTVKLLEFLESPYATTESLLADKEQKGIKRKVTPSKATPGEASKDTGKKQRKLSEVSGKKEEISDAEEKHDDKTDSETKGDPDNDVGEDISSEHEKPEEEEEPKEEKESPKKSSQRHAKEKSGSKTKSVSSKKGSHSKLEKTVSNVTTKKSASKGDTPSGSASKSKGAVSKKQKAEKEESERSVSVKEKVIITKEPGKSPTKKRGSAGDAGKGKKSAKKAKPEPSRGEMHAIVVDILKEVDFNTATLFDILKQLGTHFDMDLTHRKAEVKGIITDVINNMTDDDEDDADEEADEKKAGSGEDEDKDEGKKGESDDDEDEDVGKKNKDDGDDIA